MWNHEHRTAGQGGRESKQRKKHLHLKRPWRLHYKLWSLSDITTITTELRKSCAFSDMLATLPPILIQRGDYTVLCYFKRSYFSYMFKIFPFPFVVTEYSNKSENKMENKLIKTTYYSTIQRW